MIELKLSVIFSERKILTGFSFGNTVVSTSFADSDIILFLCPVLFTFMAVKSWTNKEEKKMCEKET